MIITKTKRFGNVRIIAIKNPKKKTVTVTIRDYSGRDFVADARDWNDAERMVSTVIKKEINFSTFQIFERPMSDNPFYD
jgi:hypothetical protein